MLISCISMNTGIFFTGMLYFLYVLSHVILKACAQVATKTCHSCLFHLGNITVETTLP